MCLLSVSYTHLDVYKRQVLALAQDHGAINRRDVEAATGLGQTAAGRLLKRMLEKGLLLQKGQGRSTLYTLP